MGSVQEDIRRYYEGEWLLSRSEYTKPWDGKHRDHPNERNGTREKPISKPAGRSLAEMRTSPVLGSSVSLVV